MIEKLNQSIRRALAAFKKVPPMRGSEWANANFFLSKESSYNEERWTGFPPQNIIIDIVCSDSIEQINIMKSARVGYTKILLIALGYFQVHKKRNQAIWLPTDSDSIDFVKTQVNTMIRDVPVVREAFKNSFERKCAENTNSIKVFDNKTVMFIRGARSAKNFRAISVDCAFLDELASFDPNPDKEGSPVLLGKKRTSGSIFPKVVCGSTPKMADSCLMEFEHKRSEYKMTFYIPCLHCETMHPLTWETMKWEKGQPETVKHHCPECGKGYTQNQYLDIWEKMILCDAEGNYYRDDEFYNSKNEVIYPRCVGIYFWTAYIPQQTWATLVQEWLDCHKDPVTRRTFINTTLGRVDTEGVEAVSPHELQKRAEPDFKILPNDVACATIGVDVQADRIEFEIVAWSEKEESWSLDYQTIWGDPLEDVVWEELREWIVTTYYEREDGTTIPISMCFIDSGYLATRVYECVDRMALCFVYACKGFNGNRPVIEHENDRRRRLLKARKKGGHPIMVGVDEAKIIVYRRMGIMEAGNAGYMHFPMSRDTEWYVQLTVEKYITKFQKGFSVRSWVKPDGARNEPLDCRVYAYAAFKMLHGSYRQSNTSTKAVFAPRVRSRT